MGCLSMAAYCMALVSSTIIFEGFILLMSVTTSGYHNRLFLFYRKTCMGVGKHTCEEEDYTMH